MATFFRFLVSRAFWLNLVFIAIFIVILIKGVLLWLDTYTLHGEAVDVPNFEGMNKEQMAELLESKKLTVEITDSLYSDEMPRGVVISQNPKPGMQVKEGRTIFVTVNSVLPEMVEMPDLEGKSRRIAIPLLEISGLKLKELQYQPDETCTDCVLDQLHKGKSISPGSQIRKGEAITLILGQSSFEKTVVPELIGHSYSEAIDNLKANSLNMGQVLSCDGCISKEDSLNAYVYRQNPEGNNPVSLGAHIDLFLTTDSTQIEIDLPEENPDDNEIIP